MSKKTMNILLVIASSGLAVAALIFIFISMFINAESEWSLPIGLFCVILSNLFNIIRSVINKQNK